MFEEKLDALSQMMAEHMAMPFPPGFRGLDIKDQDMVMLGADTYGYCLGVLKGPLDEHGGRGLIRLMAVFEGVLAAPPSHVRRPKPPLMTLGITGTSEEPASTPLRDSTGT
ncbi:hypothetical protein [Streptacidiphilus rugosus]|uniref:hypothetical protein n=1 Tax=Streptacidiphilus rugosus TaxID=405783 RepID=UPI000AA3F872|nr:hypothetical protein [Streptacidiphilus rugosus]